MKHLEKINAITNKLRESMKIFILILLPLIQTFVCSSKVNDAAIIECFSKYKASILNQHGDEAVNYLSNTTKEWYETILYRTLTLDSVQIEKLSFIEKSTIIMSRHLNRKSQLEKFNGKTLIINAINNGLIGKQSVEHIELGEIKLLNENTAEVKMLSRGINTDAILIFRKEEAKWKIDLTSLFDISESLIKDQLKRSRQDEKAFIASLIRFQVNRQYREEFWNLKAWEKSDNDPKLQPPIPFDFSDIIVNEIGRETKYWKVDDSTEEEIIGHEYPQIQEVIGGWWNVSDKYSVQGQISFRKTPDIHPPLDKLVLADNAKLSDILSASMFSHHGFVISEKAKTVFEKFNLGQAWFFEVGIIQKEKIHKYYVLHTNNSVLDIIDFDKSLFTFRYKDENEWIKKDIKVQSKYEYENFDPSTLTGRKENGYVNLKVKHMVLKSLAIPRLDYIGGKETGIDDYFSDALKIEIERNNITGLTFEEQNFINRI